jgi:hypothetical protein
MKVLINRDAAYLSLLQYELLSLVTNTNYPSQSINSGPQNPNFLYYFLATLAAQRNSRL